jgi:hypothetical protein
MSGQKNDVTYAATVAFAVAKMRELGWMPPSNTSTDPPQDDLIERLRAVEWEETDDCSRMPDDPTHKCVLVDMRPDDFRALLREAADALEAAREDATSTATSPAQMLIDAIEQEIRQLEGTASWRSQTARIASLRAAIDQARGNAGQEVGNG